MTKYAQRSELYRPTNAATKKAKITQRDTAVMNRILTQYQYRVRVDIDKWRLALKEAEDYLYPKRQQWARLVKDLDLDNHWSSQILIRKLASLCKKFKIVNKNTGEEDVVKTKLFRAPWFMVLLDTAMEAEFKGAKAVEIETLLQGDFTEDALYIVPIQNYIPDFKEILYNEYYLPGTGYKFADDPYILDFKESTKLGLLNKAAPLLIWKKNALQAWAEFGEKFGIPMRFVTTNKKDQKTLDLIESMLDKLGSAARAVFPEGTQLDFKEANTSDSFEVFDKLVERANSEVSKLVNGVTMLSDNGSSKSQSSVHFDVNKQIVTFDTDRLASIVNWKIIPRLAKLGFMGVNAATDEFQWDLTETLSKTDQFNIIKGLLDYYNIPEDWINKTFGVPVEKKAVATTTDFKPGQPSPAMTGRFSMAGYRKMLAHGKPNTMPKAEADSISTIFLRLASSFFKNPTNKPADLGEGEWNNLYTYIAEKLFGGVEQGYGQKLTIGVDTPDMEFLSKLKDNMYVFSAFKSFNLMKAMNAILLDENGKVREWNDFKMQAVALSNDYNVSWLQTEYDTAIAGAQSASKWQTFVDEKDQYNLQFQTAGDDRVRKSHQHYEGLVVAVDDPILDSLMTPLDWNCRCEWIQVAIGTHALSDLTNVSLDAVPKNFRNNIGKSGQVFTEQHPYWNDISDKDKASLNKLAQTQLKKSDDGGNG